MNTYFNLIQTRKALKINVLITRTLKLAVLISLFSHIVLASSPDAMVIDSSNRMVLARSTVDADNKTKILVEQFAHGVPLGTTSILASDTAEVVSLVANVNDTVMLVGNFNGFLSIEDQELYSNGEGDVFLLIIDGRGVPYFFGGWGGLDDDKAHNGRTDLYGDFIIQGLAEGDFSENFTPFTLKFDETGDLLEQNLHYDAAVSFVEFNYNIIEPGNNENNGDSDGNGLSNIVESGTNEDYGDSDGNGVSNIVEPGTNEDNGDSDGNGVSSIVEPGDNGNNGDSDGKGLIATNPYQTSISKTSVH